MATWRESMTIMCACGHAAAQHRFARNYSECYASDRRALPGTRHQGADATPALVACGCAGFSERDPE